MRSNFGGGGRAVLQSSLSNLAVLSQRMLVFWTKRDSVGFSLTASTVVHRARDVT